LNFSEQQYWPLISQGDKKAYEQLFKAWYQPLCNYSCSLLKDIDEAEEVVQTVFYNLWNKRESLQINVSEKSYLYRAVHNDTLNRIKHKKVRTLYAQDYKASGTAPASIDGLQTLEAKELGRTIQSALESLPEQCGIVFKLSRFEHLK
jgi:RNA polymerase sigma-70 factor (family 1)